jgi:predicted nucleic acid-binding protein
LLERLAEWVTIPEDAVAPVLADPDDDVVLSCAALGNAQYLVTYDPHFEAIGTEYRSIKIVQALPFLWVVRGDTPPQE